jgi:cytoskeletal protein CcmA (bactofilin family)
MESLEFENGLGREGADGSQSGISACEAAGQGADAILDQTSPVLSIGSDGNCCVLRSSNFSGKLRFEGAARIECHVSGEIQGTDLVTIAEGALVTGPINAASVLIAGRVRADVTASRRIEVRPSATVVGTLTAPAMTVHENAKIEGCFRMTSARIR